MSIATITLELLDREHATMTVSCNGSVGTVKHRRVSDFSTGGTRKSSQDEQEIDLVADAFAALGGDRDVFIDEVVEAAQRILHDLIMSGEGVAA